MTDYPAVPVDAMESTPSAAADTTLDLSYIDEINHTAEFFPQVDDETRPCIQVGGVQVYVYLDERGTVRVSVNLDTVEQALLDIHRLVPLRIDLLKVDVQHSTVFVEHTTVFDSTPS